MIKSWNRGWRSETKGPWLVRSEGLGIRAVGSVVSALGVENAELEFLRVGESDLGSESPWSWENERAEVVSLS